MRPQLIRLTPEYNIKPFDCEDADLNGFLLETDHTIPNARHHAIELLAVTYLIEDLDASVCDRAFFEPFRKMRVKNIKTIHKSDAAFLWSQMRIQS